ASHAGVLPERRAGASAAVGGSWKAFAASTIPFFPTELREALLRTAGVSARPRRSADHQRLRRRDCLGRHLPDPVPSPSGSARQFTSAAGAGRAQCRVRPAAPDGRDGALRAALSQLGELAEAAAGGSGGLARLRRSD